jgi:hypothetical protein
MRVRVAVVVVLAAAVRFTSLAAAGPGRAKAGDVQRKGI